MWEKWKRVLSTDTTEQKKEAWPLEDYTNSWIHLEEDILTYIHSQMKKTQGTKNKGHLGVIADSQLYNRLQHSCKDQYHYVARTYASWDSADWTF